MARVSDTGADFLSTAVDISDHVWAFNAVRCRLFRQHWWRRRVFNQFADSPGAGYLLVNIPCLADFLGDIPPSAFGRMTPAADLQENGGLSKQADLSSFAPASPTVGSAALSLEARL